MAQANGFFLRPTRYTEGVAYSDTGYSDTVWGLWLQWHFSDFQIFQSYSKIELATVTQYKPFAYIDTFPISQS